MIPIANKILSQPRPLHNTSLRLRPIEVALGIILIFGFQLPGATQTAQQVTNRRTKATVEPTQTTPIANRVVPAIPPAPDWPVNDQPVPATVLWDSRGLRVEASNASLDQILHEVAMLTGTKSEGLSQDQRIYGNYGPGPAREVLAQLLDGSGYNMLFTGDLGQGTPRQVILSTRTTGGAQPARAQANSSGPEDDAEEPPVPPPGPQQEEPPAPAQPQPVLNPFGGSGGPRTPQQIMQEIQMRQQQMKQQPQQ